MLFCEADTDIDDDVAFDHYGVSLVSHTVQEQEVTRELKSPINQDEFYKFTSPVNHDGQRSGPGYVRTVCVAVPQYPLGLIVVASYTTCLPYSPHPLRFQSKPADFKRHKTDVIQTTEAGLGSRPEKPEVKALLHEQLGKIQTDRVCILLWCQCVG